MSDNSLQLTGWICPKCDRGVAPTEKTCNHAGQQFVHPLIQIPPNPVLPNHFLRPYPGTGDPRSPSTTSPNAWGVQ